MDCPECGKGNESSHLFCSACGERLQAQPPNSALDTGAGAYPFYPLPGYQMPVAALPKTEGMFVVAMVLGILSITSSLLGVIFGPLAIIFYYRGKARLKADPTLGGYGMGLAGLIAGIVGIVFSCIMWPVLIYLLATGPH